MYSTMYLVRAYASTNAEANALDEEGLVILLHQACHRDAGIEVSSSFEGM
jgi:hypothetical protein